MEPISWLVRLLAPIAAGVYIPREALPEALIPAGSLLPQTYAVDAVRRVLLGGASLDGVAGNLAALAIQAAVLIPVGVVLLKYSLAGEEERRSILDRLSPATI